MKWFIHNAEISMKIVFKFIKEKEHSSRNLSIVAEMKKNDNKC